jgi:hypothetical protein
LSGGPSASPESLTEVQAEIAHLQRLVSEIRRSHHAPLAELGAWLANLAQLIGDRTRKS